MTEKTTRTSPKRILEIIEAVASKPDTATAANLSKSLGIPLATVYRHLETLCEERYIVLSATGAYIPGAKFRSLAINSMVYEPEVTQRRAILRKLSAQLEETVSLSVPNGAKLIYFDRFESHWPVQVNLHIGDVLPLHCCASGKLYLSSLKHEAALNVFENLNPDERAPNTITSLAVFADELTAIRERGYALDDQEWFHGMVGAAVPIRNSEGRFCASLSTHALTSRKSLVQVDANISYMIEAATSLEKLFFEA